MHRSCLFLLLIMATSMFVGCGPSSPAENPDYILAKTKLEAALTALDAEVAVVRKRHENQGAKNDLNDFAEIMDAGPQYRAKIPGLWRAMADAYIKAGGKIAEIPHQDRVNGKTKAEYGLPP